MRRMAEPFLPASVEPPDFYVAAIGRSGSTMLCNWLASPPNRLVFHEPFFLRPQNSRLLRIQLDELGMAVSDEDWAERDETPAQRFERLMAPRLQGRRWGLKEVLCEEHVRILDALAPARVLITVRNIADVALSFFEKHRVQGNLDRFSDEWVERYCISESAGLVDYHRLLHARAIPHHVVRYEDFIAADAERAAVARFVGWPGGGRTGDHLAAFDRAFEVERHGRSVSDQIRSREHRSLDLTQLRLSDIIAEQCADYQVEFGYIA
jgi:hypothetical protein